MAKIRANSFDTLDDLLYDVYEDLIALPSMIKTTRGGKLGDSSEIIGATMILNNPLSRLSRSEVKSKPFSAIGELIWYLSGRDDLDFIASYIPKYKDETDNSAIYGAYGPRLFKMRGVLNQIENIINLLKQRPSTRRAVIQLFDAEDLLGTHIEIPCTCTLQFLVRDEQLNLCVTMRSNDAYMGLPHDVFAFTMLQEIIANTLGFQLGKYYHFAGSLHLYDKDRPNVEQYLTEGYQSTKIHMPKMPNGDPWKSIAKVIEVEEKIRASKAFDLNGLSEYWIDIANLIRIHFLFKSGDHSEIENIMTEMNEVYRMYIEKRLVTSQKKRK